MRKFLLFSLVMMVSGGFYDASAQLSKNPDKFLGNITTRYNVDTDGFEYWTLWNQITPENESKWGSVEGTQGRFNWGGADNCSNYAKNHNFPFKFHAIIWGAQHPNWFNNSLTIYERKQAIYDWMDAMKKHYDKIDLIDVANECIAGHQSDTYLFVEPLGGSGASGWDWLVKAFEMAHEKWPEAILIYNDFNTFHWQKNEFIDLVTRLRDAGAPIDAYGCQSHDLTDMDFAEFKKAMVDIQNALKMPMYSSEYDIGTSDDNKQLKQYKDQIPYMWEQDYVAGITLWGWIYGATWTTDGNSGIVRDGKDRPAMTWLREYMSQPETATTKSPFPNMKKPISHYIKPQHYKSPIGEPCDITIEATMHNGATVEKVELYVNDALAATMTEAPYIYEYTPVDEKKVNFKSIVYTNDGKTYERLGGMYGSKWPQRPFLGEPVELPGVIEAENFDMGGEGISYHDTGTSSNTDYREDAGTVSITKMGDDVFFLDKTVQGEWVDYTVYSNKSGRMNFEAIVGSMASEGSNFSMFIYKDGELKRQVDVDVPYTGRRKFETVTGDMGLRFSVGEYKIRIYFNNDKAFIDKFYIGTTATAIDEIETSEATTYQVYNLSGAVVGSISVDNREEVAAKLSELTDKAGLYILKDQNTGKSFKVVNK